MSSSPQPKVVLLLSSVAFKGRDVDLLLPPFSTDYDTTVGLKWYPSATGPETWTLAIAAGVSLAAFLKKFSELLATDIYGWAKTSLKEFFSNRPHNHGTLTIELDGLTLLSHQPVEVLASVDLLATLATIDPFVAKVWEIKYDASTDTISVNPATDQK